MLICQSRIKVLQIKLKTVSSNHTQLPYKLQFCNGCNKTYLYVISGLEWDLYKNLYGQHLAQEIVAEAISNFLLMENPDRPLVLSFHGASGTGKSLVSSMLARHLYGTAMGSPYIHQYVPTLHFPLPERLQQYRVLDFFPLLTTSGQGLVNS